MDSRQPYCLARLIGLLAASFLLSLLVLPHRFTAGSHPGAIHFTSTSAADTAIAVFSVAECPPSCACLDFSEDDGGIWSYDGATWDIEDGALSCFSTSSQDATARGMVLFSVGSLDFEATPQPGSATAEIAVYFGQKTNGDRYEFINFGWNNTQTKIRRIKGGTVETLLMEAETGQVGHTYRFRIVMTPHVGIKCFRDDKLIADIADHDASLGPLFSLHTYNAHVHFDNLRACPQCACQGDPECDGVVDILDVVRIVDVAFRGGSVLTDMDCAAHLMSVDGRTDVDCDGITNVLDVVKSAGVAFRGEDASSLFCSLTCTDDPDQDAEYVTWRSLLLIIRNTDVSVNVGGTDYTYVGSLTATEINDAAHSFFASHALTEELNSGKVLMVGDTVVSSGTVTSVNVIGDNSVWLGPWNIPEILSSLDQSGEWDAITVFWKRGTLPSFGWGWGGTPTPEGAVYATVTEAPTWMWEIPRVGELFLHEWLHGVHNYFKAFGYEPRIPALGADGAETYGYARSPTEGWSAYYRDLMTERVFLDGKYMGIGCDIWRRGAPRSSDASWNKSTAGPPLPVPWSR